MFRASVGGGAATSTRYRHPLVAAMSLLLAPHLSARTARRGGWSALTLALSAILMSWDTGPTLLDRFLAARRLVAVRRGRTYQGFAKALQRHGADLVRGLRRALAAAVARRHAALWTLGRWCVFGVDGSTFNVPRTIANETELGLSRRGGVLPQIFATILVHLGSGVLWDWRLARYDAGERRGMLAMNGRGAKCPRAIAQPHQQ